MLRESFLEGMSRAATPVSVVTTDGAAGRAGVTVSALSAVSADTPTPSLLVCIHTAARAVPLITANEVFCVNLLRREQADLADIFAGRRSTPSGDKFEGVPWRPLVTGAPALAGVLVAFDCELRRAVPYGSHWIFIGEVGEIELNEKGPPLLYANRTYGEPVPLEDGLAD